MVGNCILLHTPDVFKIGKLSSLSNLYILTRPHPEPQLGFFPPPVSITEEYTVHTICCVYCRCISYPALLQTLGTAWASFTQGLKLPFLARTPTVAAASLLNHTAEMSVCQWKKEKKKQKNNFPLTLTVNSNTLTSLCFSLSPALCLFCNAGILKGW